MSNASGYQQLIVFGNVTIANGQQTSSVYNCYGATPTGIYLPANFIGSSLTFSVSPDGTNYYNLLDGSLADTDVLTISSLTPSVHYPLNPGLNCGYQFLKINAGSVQNNGDVIIIISTPPIFPLSSAA